MKGDELLMHQLAVYISDRYALKTANEIYEISQRVPSGILSEQLFFSWMIYQLHLSIFHNKNTVQTVSNAGALWLNYY